MPDDNHKPEIGLALTDFDCFAAFRPFGSIQASVQAVPELRQALGAVADEVVKGPASEALLRKSVSTVRPDFDRQPHVFANSTSRLPGHVCGQILNRRLHESDEMTALTSKLASRCKEQGDEAVGGISAPENKGLAETFVNLNDDYPGDCGAFVCAFFMNLYRLKAGECVYVPANTIHAWHRGTCFESMAASDNVFNCAFEDGIPQEFLDIFVNNVDTHIDTPASHWYVRTEPFKRGVQGKTKRYVTPFHEFDVLNTELGPNEQEEHQPIEGPSVLLASKGSGKLSVDGQEMELKEGSILLLLAGKTFKFSAGADGVQLYRCVAPRNDFALHSALELNCARIRTFAQMLCRVKKGLIQLAVPSKKPRLQNRALCLIRRTASPQCHE